MQRGPRKPTSAGLLSAERSKETNLCWIVSVLPENTGGLCSPNGPVHAGEGGDRLEHSHPGPNARHAEVYQCAGGRSGELITGVDFGL